MSEYVRVYDPQHGPCVTCGKDIHKAFVTKVGPAWVHDNRLAENAEGGHRAVPHDDRFRIPPYPPDENSGERSKLVVVCRHDLSKGVQKGKWMAQAGHASMIWLAERLKASWQESRVTTLEDRYPWRTLGVFTEAEHDWLWRSFAKIVVHVPDEAALREIWKQAEEAGLQVFPCVDAGNTVFPEPTLTCVGVGPDWESRFEGITDHLRTF